MQSLEELATSGRSPTMEAVWEKDFLRVPVTIEQFLDDDYYLGSMTKDLFPIWRKELCNVFRPNTPVHEWIFGGAIGAGKTTIASIGLTYLTYYLSCLRDPHQYYGLMPGSTIVIGVYSVSKQQSYDTSFSKIQSFIDDSPYFRECFPRVKHIKSKIVFQNGKIQVIAGSKELHAIGLDMWAFLLDEANFLQSKSSREDASSMAYKIYNAARNRLKSRFMGADGAIPGMVMLVSSKKTHRSFLETHIDEVREEIKRGTVHLSEFSQWEVHPATNYTKEKFLVEIGDTVHPSRVLKDGVSPRPGAEVIEVPGEYCEEFERDVETALREIAGIATYGVCPLIHDKSIITANVSKDLEHPFVRESVTLDVQTDVSLDTFFIPERLFLVRRSHYAPKYDAHSPRFVHIDIGLTGDCMGMAMGHPGPFKEVTRQRGDGTYYRDMCPSIIMDFMLRIKPPEGSEIDISKARSFVISLRDMGMPIIKVTTDGFQSRDLTQIMRKLDFESNVYSIDRTDEAYLYLRQTLLEKRLVTYPYRPFEIEVSDLERDIDARKVDHPEVSSITGLAGSKDVSDAVAGVVSSILIDPRALSEYSGTPSAEARHGPSSVHSAGLDTVAGSIDWSNIENQRR